MSGRQRYKGLEASESEGRGYCDPDSAAFLKSSYASFRRIAKDAIGDSTSWMSERVVDQLYSDACRLADGGKGLKIRSRDVLENVKNSGHYDGTGLYLSAILNCTGLKGLWLSGIETVDFPGYRLGKGKTMVICRGVHSFSAGDQGMGNLYNWGNVGLYMARQADWGVQINFGYGGNAMALEASGGLQINAGKCTEMARRATGGIQVNLLDADEMAHFASGGIQASTGEIAFSFGGECKGGMQVWSGRLVNSPERMKHDREAAERLEEYGKEFSDICQQLIFLHGLKKESFVANVSGIRSFDFEAFSRRMFEAAERTERYMEGRE